MRIAYLGATPSVSAGVSYAAAVLLEALVTEGIEVDLYATDCPARLASLGGLRVMLEPAPYDAISRLLEPVPVVKFAWGMGRRGLAHRRLVARLMEEHRRRPYDLVYQFSQSELLTLRRRRNALPAVVLHPEVHAAGELAGHRRENALARRCETRVQTAAVRAMLAARSAVQRRDLCAVDAVVCPSSSFAHALVDDYGVDQRRLHVIPNPVDLERFTPGLGSRRPREIVFVSRLAVRKGVDLVVHLSHKLTDLAGYARIVVAGDRAMWSDYTRLLAGLDPRIAEVRGYVAPSELAHLLAGASLLVQPSYYEPFALSVAEALACGTPVVISDRVGAGEWVESGCAAVFPAGDSNAFEAAVRAMLRRMDESEEAVRARARSAAEERFAPAVVARALIEVFEAVAGTDE